MFPTEKNFLKMRNPYPGKKWVILTELAISNQLIDIGRSIKPMLIPNFYLLIMQISVFFIPGKLVSDQKPMFLAEKK